MNTLRKALIRFADGMIVYTRSQGLELAEAIGSDAIWVAGSAIYPAAEIAAPAVEGDGLDFVISGRLVEEKKPALALRGFSLAADRLPDGAQLVFVGDGPMREQIAALAGELGIADRVELPGAEFAIDGLRRHYAAAVAALSPGSVGLSIIQCQAFGLPMVYATSEPHGPEIEAADEGFDAVSFASDDPDALADALVDVARQAAEWHARRPQIAARCRERYSVESMVEGFAGAVRGDATGRL